MPAHLAGPCIKPSIAAGQDWRVISARLAAAFTGCNRRHRDTVTFYEDLRKRLAGN
jgi:hypothetical protein